MVSVDWFGAFGASSDAERGLSGLFGLGGAEGVVTIARGRGMCLGCECGVVGSVKRLCRLRWVAMVDREGLPIVPDGMDLILPWVGMR